MCNHKRMIPKMIGGMVVEAKYLRITIHDNDFTTSLQRVGELLYETFYLEGKYPTEEDFPTLKEIIKHLWFCADMAIDLMRWGHLNTLNMEYFNPCLEFIDYLDIPDWGNNESIYIPMFDDAEILTR